MLISASSDLIGGHQARVRLITFLVAGTFFMEMLDSTVIATALPRIAGDFAVSAVALNIGITAYLLALAVFLPISGWIAERFGRRNVFASAILLFTLASALCGLCHNVLSFTAARALQGMGGAAMVPVGRLIVLDLTAKKDLAKAMATVVWPGLIAPVLGPPIGGFIVVHFSWPWIFFLNIPLGIFAAIVALIFVPPTDEGRQRRPFDVSGFLFSAMALFLIVYGLDALTNGQQSVAIAIGMTLLGGIFAVFSARHFQNHPAPLLDLSPLRVATFALVARGGSLQRVAIASVPFLLPLLFQLGFGLDPLVSGGLVLFVFFGNLAMKIVSFRIIGKYGFRDVMLLNGAFSALAIGACGLLGPTTPYWATATLLFVGGAFRSLQFASLSGIQFVDIEKQQLVHANTLATMLTQLTMGFGVVGGAALLNLSAMLRGQRLGVPGLIDFRVAFCAVMLISLVGVLDTLRLDRSTGRTIAG